MVPWLEIAYEELDTCEVSGIGNNPRIIEYHKVTTLKATADSVPWCSSFVCWCLEQSGIKSSKSAAARSYLTWGIPLEKPIEGCIVILKRGADSRQGHVGLYVQENATMVAILGGNQGNKVQIQWYRKEDVLSYRWPFDNFIYAKTSSDTDTVN